VDRIRRTHLIRALASILTGALLITATVSLTAGAADAPPAETPANTSFGFTVRPYAEAGSQARVSLDYQLAAGQTIIDKVEVVNGTPQAKSFYFYPAGAYNASGGGFALHLRTDRAVDAASWITLANDQYTIPAGTAAIVPIKISVPANAEPGDHTAGIVAEEILPAQTVTHGAGFQTIQRVATRVYIRVAGPIAAAMQVRRVSVVKQASLLPYVAGKNTANVTFTVVNSGNVRLSLQKMSVEISGPLGLLGNTVSIANRRGHAAELPSEILPGNSVTFRARFASIPPLGLMTAKVSVNASDPVLHKPLVVSGSTWFWLIPWLLVALFVILVVLLVLWWRRRRGRRARAENVPGPDRGPKANDPSDGPMGSDGPDDLVVAGAASGQTGVSAGASARGVDEGVKGD
jgi:hypothetical protein